MRPVASRYLCLLVACQVDSACGSPHAQGPASAPDPWLQPPHHANLRQEPFDIQKRDLFHGPGGTAAMPARLRDAAFTFVARDTSGWSPGLTCAAVSGVEWSVKLGPEAQSEVVSSRILWAIGFHQPPTYYLERWSLTGQESGPQPTGRFRPDRSRTGRSSATGPGTRTRLWGLASSVALIVANLSSTTGTGRPRTTRSTISPTR